MGPGVRQVNTPKAIVGQLVDRPELKQSKRGVAYARFRIVEKTPSVPGNWNSEPISTFYNVVVFGTSAENVCESLTKLDRVIVRGEIEKESWTGKDGEHREGLKIVASDVGADLRFATATIRRTRRDGE
jgi:single-strand DNA-binding protein